MRLLPVCAGILISLATGSMTAATGLANSLRFEELIRQGRAAFLAADPERAESAYSEACPADAVPAYSVAEAVTCENLLASVDEARGNLARAEKRYQGAASRAEQAGTAYQPIYCARLIDLGEYYHRRGRMEAAEQTLQMAADLARRLTASVPDLLPKALIRLGSLYADSPHPERGRAPLAEALTFARPAKLSDAEIAFAQNAMGKVELACGHAREAEPHLREAVSFVERTLGEEHPATAAYQTNLAMALIAERQFGRARLLLRRAQYILESKNRAPGLQLAAVCAELAAVAASEGKMAEAEDYAMRSLSILHLQPELHAVTVAAAKVTLASVYIRLHDLRAADSILPEAVEVERRQAVNPQTLAASVQLLAELRVEQRDWGAAEALYREAAAASGGATAPVLRALAAVLKQEGGSKQEIRSLEQQAREISRTGKSRGAEGT
jgi:tetratricopeptide (TPR) repeat protein